MSDLAVVDSSGWLEYLADTERADLFAPAIERIEMLIVPVISVYEVYKKTLRERGAAKAEEAASAMQQARVINLNLATVLEAAHENLPLADSIIYTVALQHGATLWTQDAHFDGLPSVRYFPKPLPVDE